MQSHNISDCAPARLQNSFLSGVHILNGKCNVSEAWPVHGSFTTAIERVVVEYLQCGTVISPSRQAQVRAAQMGAWNTGSRFEFFTLKVAFWRNRDTPEDLLVEAGKRTPIFCNEIGVNVFCDYGHIIF